MRITERGASGGLILKTKRAYKTLESYSKKITNGAVIPCAELIYSIYTQRLTSFV